MDIYIKIDTIFMKSGKSKTSNPHRLLPNLPDKINLKNSDKYVALSNLSTYYTQENIKKSYKNKFKRPAPTWNNIIYLMDILYWIFKIILSISLKNMKP